MSTALLAIKNFQHGAETNYKQICLHHSYFLLDYFFRFLGKYAYILIPFYLTLYKFSPSLYNWIFGLLSEGWLFRKLEPQNIKVSSHVRNLCFKKLLRSGRLFIG